MKKRTVLMITAMLVISLAGCGGKEKGTVSQEEKEKIKKELTQDSAAEQISMISEARDADASASGSVDDDQKLAADTKPAVALRITKEEYDAMTAEELRDKLIADSTAVTVEECVQLYETYAYVPVAEELYLEDNITDEVCGLILEVGGKLPLEEAIGQILVSPSANTRAEGYEALTSFYGQNEETMQLVIRELETEKEPLVLKFAINALENTGGQYPEMAQFFLKMAKNENPYVRFYDVYALTCLWGQETDGVFETVLSLMQDADESVAKIACERSGYLYDEAFVDPLVGILNDDSKAVLHGSCIHGLTQMWLDYPSHKHTSEAAYKATMDYLQRTPRTEEIPEWTAVYALCSVANNGSFEQWKENAPYYKEKEIVSTMISILEDTNASWLTRQQAIKAIQTHGTEEEIKEMEDIVKVLDDDKAVFLQKAIE